jgi:cytochrome c oxidase subunit 4
MAEPHSSSRRVYLVIFLCLAALTAVTVEAARHDFGGLNTAIALGIAFLKATLVALYFMHVRHSSRLTHLFLAAGLVWLAILILFTVSDYMSRSWPIAP